MDTAEFWSIIESGGGGAPEHLARQLEAIRQRLDELPLEELLEFDRLFDRLMDDAYTWDLWGAAYWINGGCSDDGFAYFRCWLISLGQAAYDAAVRDPDNLADFVDSDRDDHEFEELWYLAGIVYRERAGGAPPPIERGGRIEPEGSRWDFDDEERIARRLPRLAKLYL